MNILIIDDLIEIRHFLADVIQSLNHNYSIVSCECAEQGLSAIEQAPFELVVSDFHMSGMSGLDLFHKLLDYPAYKVLMTASLVSVEELKAANIHRYLAKPFLPTQITDLIQDVEMFHGRK